MLLIFDEAQTAFGRPGHWFAATHLGVTPDIMTVSKTLGGGMPLAAVITTDEIEAGLPQRGFAFYTSHVSDPLPATVGLAVLETSSSRSGLLATQPRDGRATCRRPARAQARHEEIGDVRGMGLCAASSSSRIARRASPGIELGRADDRRCLELGLSMNIRPGPSADRYGASHRR